MPQSAFVRYRSISGLLSASVLLILAASHAAAPPAGGPAISFDKDVRPALEAHCIKCHGATKPKGGVDLSAFKDEKAVATQRKFWRRVAEQIESLEMPPSGRAPLPDGQRDMLLRWVRATVDKADCGDASDRDPGKPVVRRLNRSEYDRTLRDLVGVSFDSGAAVGMPEDAVGRGYATLGEALTLPPVMLEKYLAAADGVLAKAFAPVKDGKRPADALLIAKPAANLPEREAARQVVARFARRAYRRPVEDGEVERLLKLFDRGAKAGGYEAGVRLAFKAALVSPHFLFRVERDRGPEGSTAAYRLRDHELAVRLSYFLWSSMPDEALLARADAGQLSDKTVLENEVRRMLADPKARALTDDFAVQWLQLAKLAEARPSTEFFPTFTPQLRQAMADETTTFFDRLRAEDRSVLELLDADYAYLNQDLAKHYGLTGVEGPTLRRVKLQPGDHRGGLLGMGSMLALTSHTSRTSPTLRGKWILDVVFGTPPPPPPPDAGQVDESKTKGKDAKTFRELLAQHASRASCAGCHAKIDPLGFALENYDAVGRWRPTAPGLDTSGKLPTGEKLDGADGLKKVVLDRKEAFERNLVEQLLSYALGRELDYHDECAVRDAVASLNAHEHRFSALVLGVVNSFPFQHRRNADGQQTVK